MYHTVKTGTFVIEMSYNGDELLILKDEKDTFTIRMNCEPAWERLFANMKKALHFDLPGMYGSRKEKYT